MRILADLHTHTNCSHHAHSTIYENIMFAKKRGLELIAMTDHAPAIPDSPHMWHFVTMHELPDEIEGVKLLCGIEANIIDTDGNLDVPLADQKKMDLMIASIHTPCYPPRTVEEHTKTWLGVVDNPYVTILGHSGHPSFVYDYEKVILAAKEKNKCIEINNHSFAVRKGSKENCRRIAEICRDAGAKIVVSSDAHSCFDVGVMDESIAMLEEIGFPEENIMNLTAEKFLRYLEEWRREREEAVW